MERLWGTISLNFVQVDSVIGHSDRRLDEHDGPIMHF